MTAMDIMSVGMFALAIWALKLLDLSLVRMVVGLSAYSASTMLAAHGVVRPWLDHFFGAQP